MSYCLTDEQLMIRDMVREFSRKVVAATAMKRDETKEFPADNFEKMSEPGLMGMMTPTEYGGDFSPSYKKESVFRRPYARTWFLQDLLPHKPGYLNPF